MNKRIISMLLAMILGLGCTAAEAETVKHERVYAVLSADGTVSSLTDVIRLENAQGLETLTDRTMLSGIENVGEQGSFVLDGETLTWETDGGDVVYQGTSDKPLPVVPVVTVLLDGQEIAPSRLKVEKGRAEVTVSYRQPETCPCLAVTALLLPEEGVGGLEMENASVVSLSGQQAVIGWAVPGADKALGLPASFTLRFDADHADLGWMMTAASSDPIRVGCQEAQAQLDMDLREEMEQMTLLLKDMRNGKRLDETNGKWSTVTKQLNALNEGLEKLNEGAKTLSEGADELREGAEAASSGASVLSKGAEELYAGCESLCGGAETLDSGLAALQADSEALNAGAAALFAGLLDTANARLSASGLADAGFDLPALTRENYRSVLSDAIAGTEPEAVQALLRGKEMAEAPDAEETLALARNAHESLGSLLEQLTRAETFVTGIGSYTEGVARAAEGAAALAEGAKGVRDGAGTLSAGLSDLSAGTASLSDGTAKLHDGTVSLYKEGTNRLRLRVLGAEKVAAQSLLLLLTEKADPLVNAFENAREQTAGAGYDLRAEGMDAVTVYVIRTDFE